MPLQAGGLGALLRVRTGIDRVQRFQSCVLDGPTGVVEGVHGLRLGIGRVLHGPRGVDLIRTLVDLCLDVIHLG